VINRELYFRRAFAEVFRRRSMWFLGSGLQEDYFVNLFGEIIVIYGAGSLPHFAFMTPAESEQNASFLLNRMNVTLINYSDSTQLPSLLDKFAVVVSKAPALSITGARVEERYSLRDDPQILLVVTRGELPLPSPGECTAVSVGRKDRLRLGHMAKGVLRKASTAGRLEDVLRSLTQEQIENGTIGSPWIVRDEDEYVYQLGNEPYFAVAAREDRGRRDLRSVAPSVTALLNVAAKMGMKRVHLGLLSAGSGREWLAVYSLIEIAKGARQFAREPAQPHSLTLQLHIVDDRVFLPLQAGKLHIDELLACDDIRFWAVVAGQDRQRERVLLVRREKDTIRQVADLLGIPMDGWRVETLPNPYRGSRPVPLTNVADNTTLEEFGVIHSSTLVFSQEPTARVARRN
jgi:hypothetical protein